MKTCTKCNETKSAEDFHKDATKRDGLSSNCKLCSKANNAKWRAANPDKARANASKWRAANPERAKANLVAWKAANPERVKANNAKWRAANPEQVKANNAKWAAANPDKARSRAAKWRAANPDKVLARRAKWRAANADRVKARSDKWKADNSHLLRVYAQNRRARKLSAGGKLSRDLAKHLFKLQHGKCACGCNQPLDSNTHLDHWVPLALGGHNSDGNMRLLLAKCNLAKGAKHPRAYMKEKGYINA